MALFGARRPTLTQRVPRRDRCDSGSTAEPAVGRMAAGWDNRGASKSGVAQLGLVERRHGQPERGAASQCAELPLGAQLVPGERVVPRRVVLRRRHVVEVDDEGL